MRRSLTAISMLGLAAIGCGGDDAATLSCGAGTVQQGEVCVPDTGDGGVVATAPTFAGVTDVSPASASALQVSWVAANDVRTPVERLRYNIYIAAAAGEQNFAAPTLTTPPGVASVVVQNLKSDTEQFVVVRAINDAGLEDGNVVELAGTPGVDTAPPTFGGVKSAETAGAARVKLSWDPASDDKTGPGGIVYRVYFSETTPVTGLDGAALAVSDPGVSSTVVQVPEPDKEYNFVVRAQDAAGNVSDNTEEAKGTSGKDSTPPVFGGCSFVEAAGASKLRVQWKNPSDDTTPLGGIKVNVYAGTSSGGQNFAMPDASFAASDGSGEVTGMLPGTQYFVVCRAEDAAGNIDENVSERTALTTDDDTPPVFGGVTGVTNITTNSVELTWDAATDDQSDASKITYDVWQADSSMGQDFMSPPLYTSMPGAASIVLENLPPAGIYFWVVRARDEAGNASSNVEEETAQLLVSFSLNIQTLFTGNCAVAGCHLGLNPPEGLSLEPNKSYSLLVDVNANQVALKRVKPSDSANSYLYRKVIGLNLPMGTQSMPLPGSGFVLADPQKDLIKSWIDQGALNN